MATDKRPEFFKGAQLKVAIIGCGYVGLPLALRFAEAGHRVTGFDTDPEKVRLLNAGKSYIEHIPQTKIQQFVNSRHFNAVTDFSKLKEADAIIICVPTPLNEYREPDLSYVENTAKSIQPYLMRGQLVVLESTTYPGTTEELLLPILEQSGHHCPIATGPENENVPVDFFLAFSHPSARTRATSSLAWRKYRSGRRGEPPQRPRCYCSIRPGGGARCCCKFHAGGGDDQVAREHLSLRQRRAGQRTAPHLTSLKSAQPCGAGRSPP